MAKNSSSLINVACFSSQIFCRLVFDFLILFVVVANDLMLDEILNLMTLVEILLLVELFGASRLIKLLAIADFFLRRPA